MELTWVFGIGDCDYSPFNAQSTFENCPQAKEFHRPVKTLIVESGVTVIWRQVFGTVVARRIADLALQVSG